MRLIEELQLAKSQAERNADELETARLEAERLAQVETIARLAAERKAPKNRILFTPNLTVRIPPRNPPTNVIPKPNVFVTPAITF